VDGGKVGSFVTLPKTESPALENKTDPNELRDSWDLLKELHGKGRGREMNQPLIVMAKLTCESWKLSHYFKRFSLKILQ
jgi:hypothetical protein